VVLGLVGVSRSRRDSPWALLRARAVLSKPRNSPAITRNMIALLHGGPASDVFIPALHIPEILKVDALPFKTGRPRPGRHVRNGIGIATQIAITRKLLVKHAIKPLGFRLEALEDNSLPSNGPGLSNSNGNFVLTEFMVVATEFPVPEPATASLLAMTGAVFLRRRRRSC